MKYKYFTSESVCAGHPDKICDQISDSILDAAISEDINARVAVETLVTANHITVAGEIACGKKLDYKSIVNNTIKEIGYTKSEYGFSHNSDCTALISPQSSDISVGVDNGGAGDQGMMFGYAVNETENYMPLPIMIAHELAKKMDDLHSELSYLRPDGKSCVTVNYHNGKPQQISKIVLAKPHSDAVEKNEMLEDLYNFVVTPTIEKYKMPKISKEKIILNGTGAWNIGGPSSDTGVTGRKIIVDTYGGMARHGGGAFSGKDPTKVDRSAAYAARFIAKNIVAKGMADRCEVMVSYAIGHREPVAKAIETFGTEKIPISKIEDYAWKLIDLSVNGIIEKLNLKSPIYRRSAAYGHFGWDNFPWEKIV